MMVDTAGNRTETGSRRHIGPIGTAARIVLGLVLLLDGFLGGNFVVNHGQVRTGFEPVGVLLGLLGFPALLLAWQWIRARRDPSRFQETGPLGTVINMVVFLALFLTPWYFRPLAFTSDAALVFYGASMWLAAIRGYGGCEVLAISNWLLRRDDQVGCFVLSPVDYLEHRLRPGLPG
ncbi:MAG TPA: hypothetical protein VI389_12120 [Geobacteraceae bacterium]